MTTRLVLIRHCTTPWNEQGRYCGSRDIGLSMQGKKQAARLRHKLGKFAFSRVYASGKKRALETAAIIFRGHAVTKVRDLREISFGAIEGLTHAKARERYPAAYVRWLKDPFCSRLPGSETMGAFKKRVVRAIKRIKEANAGKTCAIVCHGGTIGIFISWLKKKKEFWRYIPAGASVTVVEYRGRKARVASFGKR